MHFHPVLKSLLVLFAFATTPVFGAAEIVVQRGHDLEVSAAVYSADGRIVASAGEAEVIRLWDRESGDLIGTLPGHAQRIVGLAFSGDG